MIRVKCSSTLSNVLNFSELTAMMAPLKNLSPLMKKRIFRALRSADTCMSDVLTVPLPAEPRTASAAAAAEAAAAAGEDDEVCGGGGGGCMASSAELMQTFLLNCTESPAAASSLDETPPLHFVPFEVSSEGACETDSTFFAAVVGISAEASGAGDAVGEQPGRGEIGAAAAMACESLADEADGDRSLRRRTLPAPPLVLGLEAGRLLAMSNAEFSTSIETTCDGKPQAGFALLIVSSRCHQNNSSYLSHLNL